MTESERKRREEELIALLLLLFADYQSQYGTMPDAALVAAFERDAASRMAPLLANTFESGASGLASKVGVAIQADQAAARWAESYAGSLATELAATTNSRLAEIGQMAQAEQQEALDSLFGKGRAEAIGITETTRSDTLGQQYGAEDLAEKGVSLTQVWKTERDSTVCQFCRQLDGVAEEYWGDLNPEAIAGPPLHPRCIPGDSLVLSGSRITGVSDREFEGELIVIRTASGKHLSTTPNHKILTKRGWVPAQFVNPGDSAVCGVGIKSVSLTGDIEAEHVPARIKDVAKAFSGHLGVATATIPCTAEHFHGDGEGSKVAVIWTNRLLRDEVNASLSQQSGDDQFHRSELTGVLAAAGSVNTSVVGDRDTANCVMCGRDLPFTGLGRHPGPLNGLSLGLASENNASGLQHPVDDSAADIELASQLISGAAGEVLFDDVVEVRRNPFRDHVYNLETVGGWYIANGIIIHNCRCEVRWVDESGRRPSPPDDEVQLPARPNKPRPSSPFELQPVQERESHTATLDLQGRPQSTNTSGQPLDLSFTVPGKVHAKHGPRRLVTVSVAKLEGAWKQSQPAQYIGESSKNVDQQKLREAGEFLRRAEREGIPVEASVVDLNKQTGAVFVSDGRHRLANLRDMGFTEVQIAVPRAQVKAFEEMFGPNG